MARESIRDEIKQLTRRFLNRGGEIEIVPRVQVLGVNQAWMKPYGWDYLPWSLMGVADYGHFLSSNNSAKVGEGCYVTYSTPTEE